MSILTHLLAAHGFTTEIAQRAIVQLLYFAGVFAPEQLAQDYHAVGFADVQILEAQGVVRRAVEGETLADTILAGWGAETMDAETLERTHLWFIKTTQRTFFARKPGQERWEQGTGQWMQAHADAVIEQIQILELTAAVQPKETRYDAIAVFGSSAPEMAKRIAYARRLVEESGVQARGVYLLAGERDATVGVDGDANSIAAVGAQYQVAVPMEVHFMDAAYQSTKGAESFAQIPIHLLNAPRGEKRRADTIDTLVQLRETIKVEEKPVNSILFVSGAPHVRAQAESAWQVFEETLAIETVGDRTVNTPANMSSTLGALGGALFGAYPRVAYTFNPQKTLDAHRALRDTCKFDPKADFEAPSRGFLPRFEAPELSAATVVEGMPSQQTASKSKFV